MRAPRRRALHPRLGDHDVRRREPRLDRCDHVAARGGVGAGDDADRAREARQRALALGCEQPFGRQHALEALDRREMVAEPDALDRRRAEAELALGLVDLGLALDEHALAVAELERELVEPAPRHRRPHAGARVADP